MQHSDKSLEWAIYSALTYTLFLAAMRAMILVEASFSAIVILCILHGCNNKEVNYGNGNMIKTEEKLMSNTHSKSISMAHKKI